MPFIWDWIWEKLSGVSKKSTQPESVGGPAMDNQVRQEVVRDGGKIPAKKGNTGAKPTGVRSNNKGKAGRKSSGKTVRTPTSKNKAKSKAVPKG
jgi:hypothetical protein